MAPSVVTLATMLLTLLLSCVALVAAQNNASKADIETTCMRMNSVNDYCDIQTTCQRCVRSDGCAFDMMLYSCVAAPTDGQALYARSSNPLLNRTSYEYCADGDTLCAACTVSRSNPLCEGQNRCICQSVCNVLRAAQEGCYNQRQGYMMYVSIAAMALVLPLLVALQRRCSRGRALERDDIRAEMRRRLILQQRQREREYQRPPSALALELESWRSHRDTHMVDVGKLELKTCYALMENDGPAENTAGRDDREVENARVGGNETTQAKTEGIDVESGDINNADTNVDRSPSSDRNTTQL